MLTTHLTLVPPVPRLNSDVAPTDEAAAPAMRLSIQGRHGLFLVQRDNEEVMVDAHDPAIPRCTCRAAPTEDAPGDCEHVALLRACGFLARAA